MDKARVSLENRRDMKHTPTDLQMLNAIYDRYYDEFASFSDENKTRSTKNYVPIDVGEIGKELDVDSDIIFGRLFYHFDRKYGYKKDDGAWVHFFAIRIAGDRHCIHYPYLGSVVADLRDENKKFRIATSMATVSLVISVTSFVISMWPGG